MTATDTARDLALLAAHAAAEKLGRDIILIDVSDRLAITDVFVIITGNNERQVEAIVEAVEERLRGAGVKPLRREGHRDGRWVLLDYADIVVHVQHAEQRIFYALERLWKDCPVIPFDDPAAASVTGDRFAGEPDEDSLVDLGADDEPLGDSAEAGFDDSDSAADGPSVEGISDRTGPDDGS
jgi:ribosome-associated protein